MQRPRRGWRIPGGGSGLEMKNAAMGISWEYHGNIMNKCMKNQTNHGNIMGISWEYHEQMYEKPDKSWEYHGNIMGI
jgi:hypothetical protein